ncbi:NAD(P)/FAD-dependent oxidoreductase [Petralouisia muris]|uniref:NAD(P)/FAD-dependent oxidoreductase n=1 Tax=Petralouisia muris TaxID=3032872 RepID=A0AC61RY51_9FIRM|nr:NAD(P)/FAD-dependent oxidoreductase [Petralouisia muris]TGY96709.1 NAD(P)/FAD-dependent oxidoreductase [Petralouisia muris]
MKQTYDVIVAGAGASGLMAGIQAAKYGAEVLILEHMDRAGKKILATGNGKCNFTNEKQGIAYYRGKNPAFVLPAFEQFGLKETLEFFQELGIRPVSRRGGYYYPASGQASSVLETLLMECRKRKVRIAYEIGIRSIQKENGIFCFDTKQGNFYGNTCIIATGGKAAKKTGSDGSGIPYIAGFGHKMTEIAPALVQLQGKQPFFKEVAGIRAECRLKLYIEKEKISEDLGELQLTEFGVSGIPAFQVSRYAAYGLLQGKQVQVSMDFLPDFSKSQAKDLIRKQFLRYGEGKTAKEAMIGLFPQKLNLVFLKESRIHLEKPAVCCSKKELDHLSFLIQHLESEIIGTKGFDHAQVTAGGADTNEICPDTMESRLVPGLFFAGEVMDIDGMCGGYNLQWAWTSGATAGKYAAKHEIFSSGLEKGQKKHPAADDSMQKQRERGRK